MFIDEVLDIRLSIEPSFTETTPKAIILACDEDFATILSVHQARLSATFGPEVISMIWVQRKDLKEEDYDQRNTKNKVDRLSKLDINGAWSDSDFDTRFDALKDFALGLASIPPGTHSVEADFSLHKRTKSKLRTQLSDFSLEGKLHAAQYVKVISAAADKLAVNP
ncbi:hypothetical protein V7S43_003954 [Phytophthora oleae]|uniref:HAT C-terminal dimerisation domain-containing protein n=1 Tax=Phytophthora oleae TaxID=2107226 RepID=A0ABD3FYP4_9STRA